MKTSTTLLTALALLFAISSTGKAEVADDVCASTLQSLKEVLGAGKATPDYFSYTKQTCGFRVQNNIDGTKSAFIDFDAQAEHFFSDSRTYHYTTWGSERGTSDKSEYRVLTGQIECTTNPNYAWICLYKNISRSQSCTNDLGNWRAYGSGPEGGWRNQSFTRAPANNPCGDGYMRGEKWQTGEWRSFQTSVSASSNYTIPPAQQEEILSLISSRVDDLVLPFIQ